MWRVPHNDEQRRWSAKGAVYKFVYLRSSTLEDIGCEVLSVAGEGSIVSRQPTQRGTGVGPAEYFKWE